MCGIFAYLNFEVAQDRKHILEVLLGGLRRLEYRGYDSAGISIDDDWESGDDDGLPASNGSYPSPLVFKEEGKIQSLVDKVYADVDAGKLNLKQIFKSHSGIAHTRWATHGPPSPRNSHPQSSGNGNEFLVVHNGIITNYQELKETLLMHGFEFESDTDTEVIPKLSKFVFDNLSGDFASKSQKSNGVSTDHALSLEKDVPFRQVVFEVIRRLEGAFALVFKSRHYPNELVACRRGSPLVLGVKEVNQNDGISSAFGDGFSYMVKKPREYFIASDTSAIVEHTKKVIVLEDNELVHLHDGIVSIFTFDPLNPQRDTSLPESLSFQRALSTLEMEVEQIKKGKYEHYMQKEIHEQPKSLFTTMSGRLIHGGDKSKGVVLGGLKDDLEKIRDSRRFIFIACGSSFHAALASRQLLEELTRRPVQMEIASDFLDRQVPVNRADTAFFFSQSGETADTLLALEYALSQDVLCVGITNTVGSAIARRTKCGVHLNAGCEIGVASTKAYTSQIAAMIMVALLLGDNLSSTLEKRERIIDDLLSLPEKVRQVLKLDNEMKELAKDLVNKQSLLVFGRGYNYATALEGALKVKEISLMHSEGILAGEMKHGPLALVDEHLPVIVIATRGSSFGKQQSVIQQLYARKGQLIVICSQGDKDTFSQDGVAIKAIEVPIIEECLQPIVNIIPFQLLAYHLTVLRGLNVDQPRNLAKSVTVE